MPRSPLRTWAPSLQRLAEGEPVLAGEAALGAGQPQDQDVDAAVGAAGRGVLRQAERGGHAGPGSQPRLHPGHAPLFELADDLVGDLLVEAGAVGKGFVGRGGVGHGGSPRRAGESFLSPGTLVTGPARPFSSPYSRRSRTVTAGQPEAVAYPHSPCPAVPGFNPGVGGRVSGRHPSGRRRLAGKGEKRAGSVPAEAGIARGPRTARETPGTGGGE